MRVRKRLGGGNVGRIKAVIARACSEPALIARATAPLPEALTQDCERLSAEVGQHFLSIATSCWAAAWAEAATSLRDENLGQRNQIDRLEKDLRVSVELIAQMEQQRSEIECSLDMHIREKASLAERYTSLQSALRNAESDLRSAQRVIENFERNQRQDREDIRDFQTRIEALIGEIAVLKARRSEPTTQKPRRRKVS